MYSKLFFNEVKAAYKDANEKAIADGQKAPGMPLLTESQLRLESFVNTTTTRYTFGVLTSDVSPGTTGVNATEVRLQTNDNFHIRSIAFYVAFTEASTDTSYRLLSYFSDNVTGSVADTLNYEGIYNNGLLNINVNQVDVLTNYRLSKHKLVPQTQRISVAVDTAYDQINMQSDGIVNLSPAIMLSGAYTNTITVQLAAAITSAVASNNSRMVVIFDGIRASNAAIRK